MTTKFDQILAKLDQIFKNQKNNIFRVQKCLIANIVKFATPSKIITQDMIMPSTVDELLGTLVKILGLDAGLITAITIFITITLFLIFRFAQISALQRYFLFTISVVVILLAFLGKFTSFVPNEFQIIPQHFTFLVSIVITRRS